MEQVVPQSIPAGLLLTTPFPFPVLLTVKVSGCGRKVAVTDFVLSMTTVHVPVPVQGPPHPMKSEPAADVAVSVTETP